MTSPPTVPHSGVVEQPDAPRAPESLTATTPVDRAFAAIVRSLAREDPRFARRLSTSGPAGLGTGHVMTLLGLLATILVGVVPLAVGLHTGLVVLTWIGAAGCALLPVLVPLAVRLVLRRVRPLMG